MTRTHLRLVAACAIVLSASKTPVLGATSYPMVMSVQPVAVQAGTTAELTVRSRYSMNGSYRVLVSGTGVAGDIVDPHSIPETRTRRSLNTKPRRGATLESLKVRFCAESGALPGIRDIRLAGPYGASTVGQLLIVEDPVVVEAAGNDSAEKAQLVNLPAAVCGTIEAIEDRDYFRIHVSPGQSLVFRVRGMALENRIHDLQNHLDPILTLRSANGATVAVADNDVSGDPILCQRFDRGGDYTIEIRDVRFKGDRDWVYCLEINDRPLVRSVFPLAVAAGQNLTVEPIGLNLPQKSAIPWTVPGSWSAGIHEARLPFQGRKTNPVAVLVTQLPTIVEAADANDNVTTAQSVSIPVGINGRLEREADADVYSFRAKKGDAFTFEVVSRRLGSPLDSVLRLLDARGRTLAQGDDLSDFGRTDADGVIENWRAPSDGTYAIEIRDLLERGGPDFVYFLKISPAAPQFQLYLDTDKTELSPGTSGAIFVNCIRKNGFDGEIALSIDGLPAGVTAFCDRIPRNHRDGCIILTASRNARPAVNNVVVRGKAVAPAALPGAALKAGIKRTGNPGASESSRRGPLVLEAVARPLQETYLPGGGRGHWPVETHAVAVGAPADLRGVQLSREELTLAPGESARIDVTIERAPGFRDNVTLSARFDHLGRIYGDTLPTGVDIDGRRSKTLLTGSETRGFLTFRASPTVERMAKRPVSIMANVSINFVMKATYSSPPLFLTTAPKVSIPETVATQKSQVTALRARTGR